MKVLYRLEGDVDGYNDVSILLRKYDVIRETDKCFVIKKHNLSKDTFVLKDSTGKRFAYETIELAKIGLKKRTKRRIDILKSQIEYSQQLLQELKNM